MPISAFIQRQFSRASNCLTILLLLLTVPSTLCSAASIRGVVTDPSGAKVTGAIVDLLSGGK